MPSTAPAPNEVYREEDRQAMVETIATLSRPAIHYKVLAAGRNEPAEAFAFVAQHLREGDAVCVGVYPGDKPDMVAEDVGLFEQALEGDGGADYCGGTAARPLTSIRNRLTPTRTRM